MRLVPFGARIGNSSMVLGTIATRFGSSKLEAVAEEIVEHDGFRKGVGKGSLNAVRDAVLSKLPVARL